MSKHDDFDYRSNLNDSDKSSASGETTHRSRRDIRLEQEQQSAEKAQKHRSRAQKSNAGVVDGSEAVAAKPKYKLNKKQFLKFLICIFLAVALIVTAYSAIVIARAPKIETGNIYSLLSQSSVLYDDSGQIIDNVFADENRTIVSIDQIPEHVQKAFIALEDKTFETHHGFNVIRIFGAIKDAFFNGGHVSGTSTITQQLARNLYLSDEKSDRTLSRKITEAYYAVILEKKLSKDEILEAYLNTVYFGSGYGVQAASQAYFSKDIEDVTIAEAAALAAMPQMPSTYRLVLQVSSDEITEDTTNLIKKSGDYAYVWNDAAAGRIKTCLALMHEQGYISDEEYEEAKNTEIKDMVNPNLDELNEVSNYFADYVITQVISDLQTEYGYDYAKASNLVYNGGIQIYTTMDSQAQQVIEKEYKDDSNFPEPINYRTDSKGNILNSESGNIMLYKLSNYISDDGYFKLKSSEYEWNDDGSLTIFAGKRLAIYDTTVQGQTDYSVEFKNMYTLENGKFYSIPGGYLNIPQNYKSRDSESNLVVSADFFKDYPNFFTQDGKKLITKDYSLKQRVIQPQSAMTIVDNKTGAIKAMIGGRKISGRMLYNRATAPRQPGSSIKPLAVYSAALQKSFELAEEGETFPLVETGYDKQGTELWGDYITAGSIVIDEPTKIEGRTWPKNSYNSYKGSYTFRTALQQSVNVCAVKILAQVGVDYSYDLAEKFGLTTLVKEGSVNDLNLAALALGGLSNGASTLEMASAYTTFVNDGVHKSYSCYTKVTTKTGDVLLESKTTETEVLDPGVAWIMRDVLQTVVSEGIGSYARVSGEKVGGKTGTTSDSFDIWFDGFTANYSAAIWVGNDVNIKLSSMSNKAATLWGKIMGQIDNAKGGSYSKRPSNVVTATIDTKTGQLATEESKKTRKEYFTEGTQPTKAAVPDISVLVCSESGYLATPYCTDIYSVSGYDGETQIDEDGNELPQHYCNLHNTDPISYPIDPEVELQPFVPPVIEPGDDVIDDPDDPNYDPSQQPEFPDIDYDSDSDDE